MFHLNSLSKLDKHLLVESNCLQMEFAVRAEGSDERKRGANYLSSLGYRGLSFLSVSEMQA